MRYFIVCLVCYYKYELYCHAAETVFDLIEHTCQGNLWVSDKKFIDFGNDASALHCRSALEFLLRANSTGAISLHKAAKYQNATLVPPLAALHLNGNLCTGLGDIFYVTAVIIKQLVDSNNSDKVRLNGHKTLITLLSDSGLSNEAEIHLSAALLLDPIDASIRIRSLLMFPAIYASIDHIIQTRFLLEQRIITFFEFNQSLLLQSLDEFSLSPTFYLVYQGYNDKQYLMNVHHIYSKLYPSLIQYSYYTKSIVNNNNTTTATNNNNNNRINIGFVSSHFRKHSICKLFCGIITNLNPNKFNIYIFSSLKDHYNYNNNKNNNKEEDIMTTSLKINKNIRYVPIGMTIVGTRHEVLSRNIDILIYLDVGMEPSTPAWAASKLAKIQICLWGHPTTTGMHSMDYFISSHLYHYPTVYNSEDIHRTNIVSLFPHNHSAGNYSIMSSPPSSSSIIIAKYLYCSSSTPSYPSSASASASASPTATENISSSSTSSVPSSSSVSSSLCNPFYAEDPQSFYSEQLILLDSLGFYFERPILPMYKNLSILSSESIEYHRRWNHIWNKNHSIYDITLWLRSDSYYDMIYQYLLKLSKNTNRKKMNSTNKNKNTSISILLELLDLKMHSDVMYVLCPQSLPKFHPIFDDVISGILQISTSIRLILVHTDEKKGMWKMKLENRWRNKFEMIDNNRNSNLSTSNSKHPQHLIDQIIWMGSMTPEEYLILLSIGDVMIDPFPFGGGVTTLESLAVCTPVITIPRLQSVPNLASGMITAMIDDELYDEDEDNQIVQRYDATKGTKDMNQKDTTQDTYTIDNSRMQIQKEDEGQVNGNGDDDNSPDTTNVNNDMATDKNSSSSKTSYLDITYGRKSKEYEEDSLLLSSLIIQSLDITEYIHTIIKLFEYDTPSNQFTLNSVDVEDTVEFEMKKINGTVNDEMNINNSRKHNNDNNNNNNQKKQYSVKYTLLQRVRRAICMRSSNIFNQEKSVKEWELLLERVMVMDM